VRESWLVSLGLCSYDEALILQHTALRARAEGLAPDMLLLLEHPPVITLGRGADPAHVIASREELARRGIAVRETDRGGDVTLHAPGQLVGYPIVDLRERGRDVHRYLRDLEEVLIRCLSTLGLDSGRISGATGVWIGNDKVAAIGVAVKRWVTCHGFALNVDVDLSLFGAIIPCGLVGRGVTSLSRLLGRPFGVPEAAERVTADWSAVFSTHLRDLPGHEWLSAISGRSSSVITASRNTRTSVGSHCEPAPASRTLAASTADIAER
jgi:lipoate-protein ligase B